MPFSIRTICLLACIVCSNSVTSGQSIGPVLNRTAGIQPVDQRTELGISTDRRPISVAMLMRRAHSDSQRVLNSGPTVFTTWWDQQVSQPMRSEEAWNHVSVNSLLISALQHSAQIETTRDIPLIRETAITEADAEFDWLKYAETFWSDVNDPVGSTLTTGGADRFNDHHWNGSAGLRRRNTSGGQFDISQRFGHQDTNSIFFIPPNQGTARLTLNYTQPLLRGRGRLYNTSLIVLANIDTKIAFDELSRQLQSHLLEVTRAYWGLYLERANLSQRLKLYTETQDVLDKLEARQELDTYRSQLVRARAAVAERRSQLLRSEAAIRNAEARVRALVNDPAHGEASSVELIPSEPPIGAHVAVSLPDALATSMQNRPEIQQAMQRVCAACVRLNMAKNEVLPVLNAVAETYMSGLRGESNIGQAWVDQFGAGSPSYSIGLQYEMPIWNRGPCARLKRRQLEVRQLQNQLRATSETLKMEVEVAVREVETSFGELSVKNQAMKAAAEELDFIHSRWELLTGEDGNASLVLDNLLRAQERVTEAEYDFLNAQVTYNLSLMNLKRADGTLLQSEQIIQGRACECDTPRIVHEKEDYYNDENPLVP